jgi:meso-butanediol dehydrogenase / (S,S)-butanediol dehydrogenase / diacetyl reductase
MSLVAKVAVVTGGARGIGAATAIALAEAGARVIIGDLEAEAGRATADAVGGEFVLADISRAADAEALMSAAADRFGGLDVLVNNAGVVVAKSALDTSEEEWDRVLAINLKGAWLCARAAVPHMIRRGGGAIVNVASNAGLVGFPNAAAYCASKGGLAHLTKAMALDFAPFKVRVNAVCPGHTRTPMGDSFVASQADPAAFLDDFVGLQHPLGRMAEPEEIALCIRFLAGDDASFVTGAVLPADGGFTAR